MKRAALWAIAALLVATLAGCGSGNPPEAAKLSTAQPPASTAPASQATATKAIVLPTATAAGARPAEATSEPEMTDAPEPTADEVLDLDSRDEGLDSLSSYRMTWTAEWSGTEDGQVESGSWHWVEEYNADPEALHWMWNVEYSKDASKNSALEWWQVGNTTYMITGENDDCLSMSSADSEGRIKKGSIFNPGSLGRVEDARYVGQETVNGVPARHYKYDEGSAAVFGSGKVSGEIWVAVDGGFVVKELTSWTGGAGLFGIVASDESEGEGNWVWELSDVNEAISITPPTDCGGAANELPIMADATDQKSFGDMTSYSTASAVEDVVAFYQEAMPVAGWKQAEEPTTLENMSMLSFSKDDQQAQIIITRDDDKTSVVITVSK